MAGQSFRPNGLIGAYLEVDDDDDDDDDHDDDKGGSESTDWFHLNLDR
jgi:hypothetical protein